MLRHPTHDLLEDSLLHGWMCVCLCSAPCLHTETYRNVSHNVSNSNLRVPQILGFSVRHYVF